ncbi:MAG: hypothetical protein ACQESP_11005 [Candidatus Muiribacteriota bacterium]
MFNIERAATGKPAELTKMIKLNNTVLTGSRDWLPAKSISLNINEVRINKIEAVKNLISWSLVTLKKPINAPEKNKRA